ncbi:MAG: exo-alpha-sialidase [Chloroflexi bacterium]|nr:MAG: exo-alpha-sialidase [Chloroflexota bacterium]
MSARFLRAGLAVVACLVSLAPAGVGANGIPANSRVTQDNRAGSYTRYDGGTDATMTDCSINKRAQNEPTVAVDPRNPSVVVAGSNDYCAAPVNGDVWAGYYRSTDGGASWRDSLLPGYPNDSSAGGLASPAHGACIAAGDPTQSFDRDGRLFYGLICFNRGKPVNGSTYVATYDQDGSRYLRTVLVDAGTPSAQFVGSGLFQDKINLAVDQTRGPNSGNVYVAWARYSGKAANNVILFSRSTDHGATFSPPARVSPGLGEEQFADLAVAPDGTVYLTYRDFAHQGSTTNTISVERSTDGGQSFSQPQVLATFQPFEGTQFSGNGSDSCGDGPFACPSGLTYSRFSSLSAVTADRSGVHVVWNGELASGQSKIFVRNSPDGTTWSAATTIDANDRGHQYFPDIASADGVITVVFYDSRNDPAYAPTLPTGNTADGRNSGGAVDTFVARSTDGGQSWTESRVSSFSSNYNWETHGSRMVGFWGDYIYVSAVHGAVNVAWTDSRDLVPGVDPRDPNATDGFDILQCNASTLASCNSQGGLDQNIYAARP